MNVTLLLATAKKVLTIASTIAPMAKDFYDRVKVMFGAISTINTKPEGLTLQGLEKKINQLEQNDLEQSKLFFDISQAVNNLSELSSALATRMIYVICVASISFIISIYLLIKSFL